MTLRRFVDRSLMMLNSSAFVILIQDVCFKEKITLSTVACNNCGFTSSMPLVTILGIPKFGLPDDAMLL